MLPDLMEPRRRAGYFYLIIYLMIYFMIYPVIYLMEHRDNYCRGIEIDLTKRIFFHKRV